MVGMRSKYPLNLLLLASWGFQQPGRLKNKESKKKPPANCLISPSGTPS